MGPAPGIQLRPELVKSNVSIPWEGANPLELPLERGMDEFFLQHRGGNLSCGNAGACVHSGS